MPPDLLKTLPGCDPDVRKNRIDARQIMERLGYGPDNRLKVKVSVRDLPFFRAPAVIMIDQLKEVYIDGELEMIDTTNWLPKVMRKDYTVGFSPVGGGPDPDNNLYLNYGCGGELNYNGYCNPEVDKTSSTVASLAMIPAFQLAIRHQCSWKPSRMRPDRAATMQNLARFMRMQRRRSPIL
jgi:peptide/nickel transport system substrate-binding protein